MTDRSESFTLSATRFHPKTDEVARPTAAALEIPGRTSSIAPPHAHTARAAPSPAPASPRLPVPAPVARSPLAPPPVQPSPKAPDRPVPTKRSPLPVPKAPAHQLPEIAHYPRGKRTFDATMAATALALLAPLMLTIALISRIVDGPNVLFAQRRIGLGGKSFILLKFRSLAPDDELESATRWNVDDDHRLSRWGSLLRRTSLDELPQLINVLRGEMSLVGPRPERPHFVERFSLQHPNYPLRHRMPAGLTGWAQVNGLRGDTSIAERARFDNLYIDNWSFWVDIAILLRTPMAVVRFGADQ